MIRITGSQSYEFIINKSLLPISYLNPEQFNCNRKLEFSDTIIKLLELYFNPNISLTNFILTSDPIMVLQSDLDTINYQTSCSYMSDSDFFSEKFRLALQNKNNLRLVPRRNNTLYLTITLFNHILNYLCLDGIKYPPKFKSFGDDFQFIKKKLKIPNIDEPNQKKIVSINNLISIIKNAYLELSKTNFDLYIPLPICINLVRSLILNLYQCFKIIYWCKKRNLPNMLPSIDLRFVCLVESVHLKILARDKNKNKHGFVHFYKYFAYKHCDCANIHNLESDKLLDEIKFIAKSNYIGCEQKCKNFYENQWDCTDLVCTDVESDEPILDDFVIWEESNDSFDDGDLNLLNYYL